MTSGHSNTYQRNLKIYLSIYEQLKREEQKFHINNIGGATFNEIRVKEDGMTECAPGDENNFHYIDQVVHPEHHQPIQNLIIESKSSILSFFHEWSLFGPYSMDNKTERKSCAINLLQIAIIINIMMLDRGNHKKSSTLFNYYPIR
uniref:Uncharacterized protein n=1 Tax=Onchocerca volvulus TaxID=6282 RepID=A0A8R1XUD9_ONCVO